MGNTVNGVDLDDLPRVVADEHPEWVELSRFAWRLAAEHVRESRGRRHMDAAWDPGRNFQWVWDTCFIALYCRYSNGMLPGVESLDNFYELQRDDGYISMTYDLDSGEEVWPDRINPPLFAWVEWERYRSTGDASRFERVAPSIERLMEWIDANRRTEPHRRLRAVDAPDAGRGESEDVYSLYWFADSGSSGLDDSPRTPRHHDAGKFFDWIDLSCQMALSFDRLAAMRDVLGDADGAARLRRRAEEIGRLVNDELWCERTRFYHDRTLPANFVASKTVAGFWPMVAGVCPDDRAEALVEHLLNEREFNRPVPVASLSADDPNYCEKGTYWRGGVWAPTNYMVVRGLRRVGRTDVAHDIASRYLDGLAETYAAVEPHTLWECNSPEAARPGLAAYTTRRVKPDFVGWSGLGPTAMLIEDVIGLDIDAASATTTWQIRLSGRHGMENIAVAPGGKRADFVCVADDRGARGSIRSGADMTVTLRRDGREKTIRVAADAETEFTI